MKMSHRGLRMPDDLYFKLQAIAEKEYRSTSRQIVRVLEQYIADYEKEHGTIHLDDSE